MKIAALLATVGVALLAIFVLFAPKLISADILDKFLYVILLPWALFCAVVLFGVLKSYARVRYRYLGTAVELGGPAAFAALVVVGGFVLVPRTESFDLTIRPHGPREQLISRGALRLELDNRSEVERVTDKGEADFKGIAHKFRGGTVKVLPQIEGYEQQYQDVLLSGNAVNLLLVPSPPPESTIRGRLFPVPRRPEAVRVLVGGETETMSVDAYGRFHAVVHKKLGETVRLSICSNGRFIYDDILTISSDEMVIRTHEPRERCGLGAQG